MKRKVRRLDWNLYTKLIDEIAKERPDARVWEIFFGDPCLCKDMAERIRYAKNKGLTDVVLNSNGLFLTKKVSAQYVRAGLDYMYVGIDASTKATYDKIRIGGDFNTVIRNVLDYRSITDRIFVQFVDDDLNRHEMEEFKAYWKKHDVKVKIRPKVSWIGRIHAKNLLGLKRNQNCYWLENSFNVLSDGRVALCACDVHCVLDCGNVNESTIKEIWGGKLKEYREKNPPECLQCRDWESAYAEYH